MLRKIVLLTGLIVFISSSTISAQITFSKHVIVDSVKWLKKHAVADIDLDSDLDIICTANPESSGAELPYKVNVFWIENLNSDPLTFNKYDIDLSYGGATAISVGDLTGDGYPDVVAGTRTAAKLVWYKNDGSPANGGWTKTSLGAFARLNYSAMVIDIDLDGYLDILDGFGYAAYTNPNGTDTVRWLENSGGSNPSFIEHYISTSYSSPSGVFAADLDNDTDMDIISSAWTTIDTSTIEQDEDVSVWTHEAGDTWSLKNTIQQYYGGNDVYAADLDDDNDNDLIGAGWKVRTIDWWANNGGATFGSKNLIKSSFIHPRNVAAYDLDGDADLDLLACADNANTVSWFENNGNQIFTERQISTTFTYAYYVTASDMDGDGDMDVIGSAQNADDGSGIEGQLAWWENGLDEEKTIAAGNVDTVHFWNHMVIVDFTSGDLGTTSVFYNHGYNSNRSNVYTGVNHVAQSGFYTIVANKGAYLCDLTFSFAGISEWSAVNDENDLLICIWDNSLNKWKEAGSSQTVDVANDKILVSGLTSGLERYSLFTIGSRTSDNSLPVELLAFKANILPQGIQLEWMTASEIDNLGFELWRKSELDSDYVRVASHENDEHLVGLGNSSQGNEYSFIDNKVLIGQSYYYALYDVGLNGQRYERAKLSVDFVPKEIVRVNGLGIPAQYGLEQNYPNPFNAFTIISFSAPQTTPAAATEVTLEIFNTLGQRVRTLFEGALSAGNYELRWDGRDESGAVVASGAYIYRLRSEHYALVKKMTFAK